MKISVTLATLQALIMLESAAIVLSWQKVPLDGAESDSGI